jgi:hypothetical protein
VDSFENLPKGLTKLAYRCQGICSTPLDSLPRQFLRVLILPSSILRDHHQILPFQNITTLRIGLDNREVKFDCWPPTLLSLSIDLLLPRDDFWTTKLVKALPQSLTHLCAQSMQDYLAQFLPYCLNHLQLTQVLITGKMACSFGLQAPENTMIVPDFLFFDPVRFRGAASPSSWSDAPLEEVKQRRPFSNRPCMFLNAHIPKRLQQMMTVNVLTTLPPHITALEFNRSVSGSIVPNQNMQIFANLRSLLYNLPSTSLGCHLSSLTILTSLTLFDRIPFMNAEQMPPNLTHFALHNTDSTWKITLPISLRFLQVPYVETRVLSPLTQLESLSTSIQVDKYIESLPKSLTQLQLEILRSPSFLPLIDALPNLKSLKVPMTLTQAHLDGLISRKRTIELSGIAFIELERPEAILEVSGVKSLGERFLADDLQSALCEYYPSLSKSNSVLLKATFRDEKLWRRIVVPRFPEGLTVVHLGPFFAPDRFTRWLPRSITDLDILEVRGTSHRTASGLPPSLTRLAISGSGFNVLAYSQLPRSITDLRFFNQRKLWPKYAEALPPSLRLLRLDVTYISHATIAALPRTLERLDFGDSATTLTAAALTHLPPSLTYLGGSLPKVDQESYIQILGKMSHINTWHRYPTTELEIKNEILFTTLESSNFDSLVEHFSPSGSE